MEPDKLSSLSTKLSSLRVFILNVANINTSLDSNETRLDYAKIYKNIKETLADPDLEIYAPSIQYYKSSGGSGHLSNSEVIDIVNSGTRLIAYLDAVLRSESRKNLTSSERSHEPANVFISHGRVSSALNLVRDFIDSLGLIPIIVKDEPSQGMSVDAKVTAYMKVCQSAVILATGDDQVVGSSTFQPRPNVIHEIGLAQELLTNRITYLLEENCNLPSNVAPKVYERFTKDNLSNAFIAIARDLRAFHLL